MIRLRTLQTVSFAVLLCLLAAPAWAGGLIMYEVDSPTTGTASAGWAAVAKDAATSFQNPAGMTRLDRSQVLAGVQPLIITSKFEASPGTRVMGGGDNGGNAGPVIPSAAGYYVYSASDRLKLGLSALSYMGVGLDYGDSWVGRYRVEETALITATVAPSIAYRINNWLSMGALLNIMTAHLKSQTGINNGVGPDGQVTYKDTVPGIGAGVGVLIEPTDSTRLGVTWYSPVSLTFNSTPSFSGLGPFWDKLLVGRQLGMTLTVPQWVMVSGYQQVNESLALMANFGWQNWKQFGTVDLALQLDPLSPLSRTTNLNMDNTWHGALGVQYHITKPWLLSLGFAYDSSPMSEANRSPSLPLDRTWRAAAGVQYDWSPNLTLGFAYEYINMGSASLNQQGGPFIGTLVGDYSPNMVNVVNLNLIYKF